MSAEESKIVAESPAGGCSLGCGSFFVLVAIVYPLLLAFTRSYEPDLMVIPFAIGGLSFVVGHILAVVALRSSSNGSRRLAKAALLVMWGGIAAFAAVLVGGASFERLFK
jgi:hypothetical protein